MFCSLKIFEIHTVFLISNFLLTTFLKNIHTFLIHISLPATSLETLTTLYIPEHIIAIYKNVI